MPGAEVEQMYDTCLILGGGGFRMPLERPDLIVPKTNLTQPTCSASPPEPIASRSDSALPDILHAAKAPN